MAYLVVRIEKVVYEVSRDRVFAIVQSAHGGPLACSSEIGLQRSSA